jgi:hypothetical protein
LQLNGDAESFRVGQYLPQQRCAGAAIVELRQQHQLPQVDEVWTVLNAHVADWQAIAFNDLMRRRVPAVLKVRILFSQVPSAKLALDDVPIGLMVHAASELRIRR